jgi:hypothetical protein
VKEISGDVASAVKVPTAYWPSPPTALVELLFRVMVFPLPSSAVSVK